MFGDRGGSGCFLETGDTTRSCYIVVFPEVKPWKGCLFLVAGFGETAGDVALQTDLPEKAARRGIVTVIPTFQDGVASFGFDSVSQRTFGRIIDEVTHRYGLQEVPYYLCGFSRGGSAALKFAETAARRPKAVFAIDSPLDFERFYYSNKRDMLLFAQRQPGEENVYAYLASEIERRAGSSPRTALENYHKMSPYSFSDTSLRAAKGLVDVPVRIYIEPAIEWWLQERQTDASGLNVTDCSALINELRQLGNRDAALIVTHGKGFRNPGRVRHPHFWSIVDNDELVEWLLRP